MLSQPGKETITIHILPNASRNQKNQTVEFGQAIKYKNIILFLEKSCRK